MIEKCIKPVVIVLGSCLLLWLNGLPVCAQSTTASAPSPIRSNTLTGTIAARDLGDSRLTDHYYAFTGIPGDVVIRIQSKNLNGDLDIFTAGTLRPLLKLTLYSEISTPATKSIYLRRREDLILRIEARSPNDEEGTYELTFSGSFEPIVGGQDIAEAETPSTNAPATSVGGRRLNRVNSVGARIAEPAPTEVAVSPTPEPTPEPSPASSPESPSPKTKTIAPAKRATPQNARNRRPVSRRATTPPAQPKETAEKSTEEARKSDATKIDQPPAETAEATTKPKAAGRTAAKRGSTTARAVKPTATAPAEPEAEQGPRLMIETNDGTLINRSMSGIRRVLVENGQVVVVGKDGKIDRILLSNVVRMSIQP